MGKKSMPSPDPRIGQAALKSAELGADYLEMMRGQMDIANRWADEDRARFKGTFQPLEDQFIADAKTYDSPERKAAAASEAAADVATSSALAAGTRRRQAMAVGIRPDSGRFLGAEAKAGQAAALASAGAKNVARRQVEAMGDAKRADAINLGKGMAVNPGTSLGIANSAGSAGFQGAMQGQGQMGNLLNAQYRNQMAQWEANQGVMGSTFGAIGNIIGASGILSTKKAKTDKRKAAGILEAVREMPVEKWRYKPGMGDGGEHVGPYAEDFQKATGLGDGKTIGVIDALGVTMGAVKELDAKVDKLARRRAA